MTPEKRKVLSVQERTAKLLPYARAAQLCFGVDPWLMLALAERETWSGELLGPDLTGDGGHGHGIWQIDDRSHGRFLSAVGADGVALWRKPAFNCLYATELLRDRLLRFSGLTNFAFVAAIAAFNASEERVKRRLEEVAKPLTPEALAKALDILTTGQDYVSFVLRKIDEIKALHGA